MIGILGDLHGDLGALKQAHDHVIERGGVALIQVGDFGFHPTVREHLARIEVTLPTYVIDGNHENFSIIRDLEGVVTPLVPNVHYVGRGTKLTLDGKRIAFLGGAGSIDKDIRIRLGWLWQPDELITDEDCKRTSELGPVDLMITHCPPQRTIIKHFETPEGIAFKVNSFGVSPDWSDPSAAKVEAAWVTLGCPPLVCGHMHRSVDDGGVRILNVNELMFLE